MRVIFRDHFMSDLIGFVYSKMEASHAAADFLHRIRENCSGILSRGRDAMVPIILDGENAWEYYHRNGRPFLRELYRAICDEPRMQAVTVSEALRRIGGIWTLICWPGCQARSAASRTRWQRQSLPGSHAVAEWADAWLWAVSCAG